MFEQDYIKRLVNEFVRVLAKVFLDKEVPAYVLPDEENYSSIDLLHIQLLNLIKQGKINQAENLLFLELDPENKKYIEVALDFYSRLNDLDDDFLQKNDFSKEEIEQGIEAIAKELGVSL